MIDTARPRTSRQGLTLIELLISLVFLATLILAASSVTDEATDAFQAGSANESLTVRAHYSLERVLEPLAEAELASLPPLALGDDLITYRRAVGFAGGATQWGPTTQVSLQFEAGEFDDDVDNDGDGLVDEGEVLWLEDAGQPGERRLLLARGVREYLEGELANGLDDNGNGFADERGFWLDLEGDVLTLRLTLERLDPHGRLLVRSVESSTRIRN